MVFYCMLTFALSCQFGFVILLVLCVNLAFPETSHVTRIIQHLAGNTECRYVYKGSAAMCLLVLPWITKKYTSNFIPQLCLWIVS